MEFSIFNSFFKKQIELVPSILYKSRYKENYCHLSICRNFHGFQEKKKITNLHISVKKNTKLWHLPSINFLAIEQNMKHKYLFSERMRTTFFYEVLHLIFAIPKEALKHLLVSSLVQLRVECMSQCSVRHFLFSHFSFRFSIRNFRHAVL